MRERLFGIGTWLNLNGIWIELPLLIPRLPEGWKLSAQLGMASNLANIGPLLIALIRHLSGKSSSYEVPSIMVIFVVGIVVPFLLSFTWSNTLLVFGVRRSVYLLFFGFCLALVNCTSSVTYLPFVNRFPKKWLNFYFAGESLSSLIPALLGIIQGIDDQPSCPSPPSSSTTSTPVPPAWLPFSTTSPPSSSSSSSDEVKRRSARFSVQVYLGILSVLMFCSFVAFLLLWRLQPKKQRKSAEEQLELNEKDGERSAEEQTNTEKRFSRFSMLLLGIVFWTSILLIGCIPSINSYSLNPYGPMTFHYVLILCQFFSPPLPLVGRCIASLLSFRSMLLSVRFFHLDLISEVVSSDESLRDRLHHSRHTGILLHHPHRYDISPSSSPSVDRCSSLAFRSPCSPFVDEEFGKYLIVGSPPPLPFPPDHCSHRRVDSFRRPFSGCSSTWCSTTNASAWAII